MIPPLRSSGTPSAAAVAAALAQITNAILGGQLTVQVPGLGNTLAQGLLLVTPTAATSLSVVQFVPELQFSGSAWVAGAPRTMGYSVRCEPRTSGHVDLVLEYDSGSGRVEICRWTTSEPNLFVAALLAQQFVSSGGGYIFQNGAGIIRDGNGALLLTSPTLASALALVSEGGLKRSPRNSSGGPKKFDESGAAESTNDTPALGATFTPPANCRVHATATFVFDDSGGDGAVLTRMRRFKVVGGTVTPLGAAQQLGTDNLDVSLVGVDGGIDTDGTEIFTASIGLDGITLQVGTYLQLTVFEAPT